MGERYEKYGRKAGIVGRQETKEPWESSPVSVLRRELWILGCRTEFGGGVAGFQGPGTERRTDRMMKMKEKNSYAIFILIFRQKVNMHETDFRFSFQIFMTSHSHCLKKN